jgi:hypothetical protein
MVNPRQVIHAIFFTMSLSLLWAASVDPAQAQQDFTLTIPGGLHTPAVNPGGSATADINLQPVGSFSGSVTLTCLVTSQSGSTSLPTCLVSPSPAVPPAQPSLTVNTTQDTTPGSYQIAVTGTSGSSTPQTATVTLGVTPLSGDYTISVSPTTATPSPVNAGLTATTVVTVTPIGSYTGSITLSCFSVTPVVSPEPFCSFQPTNGTGPVLVTSGTPATATMTIITDGPIPNSARRTPRIFYAFLLAVPGLALVGVSRARNRGRRLMGLFLLLGLAGSVLLMPSCGSSTRTNNPSGLTTPKNTYTFTLSGADQNGAGPSNTTTNPATVTLAVN